MTMPWTFDVSIENVTGAVAWFALVSSTRRADADAGATMKASSNRTTSERRIPGKLPADHVRASASPTSTNLGRLTRPAL